MDAKTNCCRCKKYGKVTWANYAPYCSKCLTEKSKGAESFEEAIFGDEIMKKDIKEIKKRLSKIEEYIKKTSSMTL